MRAYPSPFDVRCSVLSNRHFLFYDDYARQYVDDEHSDDEERFIMLGMSIVSQVLVVCHCERAGGQVIRIISARKATTKERHHYEGPS